MADSHQMFINGEWVNSSDGGTRDIISPASGAVIASVQEGTAEDTNRAIAAAKTAFYGEWYDMTPKDRRSRCLEAGRTHRGARRRARPDRVAERGQAVRRRRWPRRSHRS